ncbi:hypothetical protein [Polyangium sp. 6x1]|uniref:hypothetical protein n=1 Tax=Polyangium sp. 6x1 TaxID=3042689 RepID=UPI0024828F99|nr:hypothetical protein [Polyangium sp. 6x1]MDI1448433.1 hypothetical protein [Polyangium sp. 6x1]
MRDPSFRFPVERYRVHVAPSFGGTRNTIRLVRTIRWIGALPAGAPGMFVLARDEHGALSSLSKVSTPGAMFDIDLRRLEPDKRHEIGSALAGAAPQPDFTGPRIRFRPSELLAASQQIHRDAPADEGQVWLACIEIIEPPPHDEAP